MAPGASFTLVVALAAAAGLAAPAEGQTTTHGAGVNWTGSHGGVNWDGGHDYRGGTYSGYPGVAPPPAARNADPVPRRPYRFDPYPAAPSPLRPAHKPR